MPAALGVAGVVLECASTLGPVPLFWRVHNRSPSRLTYLVAQTVWPTHLCLAVMLIVVHSACAASAHRLCVFMKLLGTVVKLQALKKRLPPPPKATLAAADSGSSDAPSSSSQYISSAEYVMQDEILKVGCPAALCQMQPAVLFEYLAKPQACWCVCERSVTTDVQRATSTASIAFLDAVH